MLFLLWVVGVFAFELLVVALAVAAWMISQALDQHDFSIQSTEDQKRAKVSDSPLSNGKEEFYIPGSVRKDGQLPCLNGSPVRVRAQIRAKHNVRNSLDWDTAFLTSPGLLDPEELACLSNGVEQVEKQMVTGFHDDFWRCTDSISTLGSDNLILENFEAEFFEDIRASIQKLSQNAFAAASETCQATSEKSQAISSKWKNISSQKQRQQPALKKRIGLSKSLTNQDVSRLGTMRGVEQDAQTEQPVNIPGNSNQTLPNSRRVNKDKSTPAITAERSTVAANRENWIQCNKMTFCTVQGKSSRASKKPLATGARKVLTKPPPNQINFGDRSVKTPSSNSTFKTSSKDSTTIMATPNNAAVAAYLMTSETSPSISPVSSLSKWSSPLSLSPSPSPSPSSASSADSSSCSSSGSRRFDLREGLDWHNAFFTSDGLLDPEELSCLFNGAWLVSSRFSTPFLVDLHDLR